MAFTSRQVEIEQELASIDSASGSAVTEQLVQISTWLEEVGLEKMLTDQTEPRFWRVLTHQLLEYIDLGYEYRGPKRAASVWLAGYEPREEVKAMVSRGPDEPWLWTSVTQAFKHGSHTHAFCDPP